MFIPEEVRNNILEKTDLEELVGSYVKLKRSGRNFMGLCPFHNEKTPSFSVSPDKGMFHCFSCKKGGNAITFLMEIEKFTFPEAISLLAQKIGINLEAYEGRTGSEEISAEAVFRKQLSTLYDKISVSFNYILNEKKSSASPLAYLKERGLSDKIIEKFRIGYIPSDRIWLYNFLRKKNYSEEFLAKTALFSSNYKKISFFSGRIIFPIFSKSGQVIAFGGRALGNNMPKYLNSPETISFKKSEALYGINFATKSIRTEDTVFVVEGYMDVIAMVQAGVENVVATLGTSFTETHAIIIRRNCQKIILLFDGDEAGFKATVRTAFICEKASLDCFVIPLENGSDPADILKKNGPETLKNISKYPINCFDFILNKYKNIYNLYSEEGIKGYLNKLFAFVLIQESQVRRAGRLKAIAEAINAEYRLVYDDFIRYTKKEATDNYESALSAGRFQADSGVISAQLFLMLAIIDNYDYFYMVRDELSIDDIKDRVAKNIYIILEECYRNNSFSPESIIEKIENDRVKEVIIKKISSDEFSVNPQQIIEDSIRRVKLENLLQKRHELEKMIGKEEGKTPEILEDLIAEKLFYDKEIEKLKGIGGSVRVTQ